MAGIWFWPTNSPRKLLTRVGESPTIFFFGLKLSNVIYLHMAGGKPFAISKLFDYKPGANTLNGQDCPPPSLLEGKALCPFIRELLKCWAASQF